VPGGGVHFRVWAPKRTRVEVVVEDTGDAVELGGEADGYFAGLAPRARCGTRYRFRLDAEAELYPDPASRFQPDGPHGASEVIDASVFEWKHDKWAGLAPPQARVLYEPVHHRSNVL